jgi:hypothetical protein
MGLASWSGDSVSSSAERMIRPGDRENVRMTSSGLGAVMGLRALHLFLFMIICRLSRCPPSFFHPNFPLLCRGSGVHGIVIVIGSIIHCYLLHRRSPYQRRTHSPIRDASRAHQTVPFCPPSPSRGPGGSVPLEMLADRGAGTS